VLPRFRRFRRRRQLTFGNLTDEQVLRSATAFTVEVKQKVRTESSVLAPK
jgi:hypothetical protein